MEKNIISANDFIGIKKTMDEIKTDDTPFAIVNKGELSVAGDMSKTENIPHTYKIGFRVPANMMDAKPENAVEMLGLYIFNVEYEIGVLTPRRDLMLMQAVADFMKFYNRVTEDGKVEDLTDEELRRLFAYAEDDIILSIYRIVGWFLGIDDKLGEYMKPAGVIVALNQLMKDYPQVFNEADLFFG